MKHDITRDIVSDLWPLYRSGEASPETERMIEAFLDEDAAFRAVLEKSERITKAMPEMTLALDPELERIKVMRERTRLAGWLVGVTIAVITILSLAPFIIAAVLFGPRVF
jgi:ferric-dicitrate binding protein FerR (iron transport regulator)